MAEVAGRIGIFRGVANSLMPYQKFTMRPGVDKTGTAYSAEGGWYDCNNVRFRNGRPESVGGWSNISSDTFLGAARNIHDWSAFDGSKYGAVGTDLKTYIEYGNAYYDITPVVTQSLGENNAVVATVTGTVKITPFTPVAVVVNDYILISNVNSSTLLGASKTLWNTEHRITSVETTSGTPTYFTIDIAGATGSVVTENFSISYLHTSGLTIAVPGTGWGSGTWGRGTWGSAVSTSTLSTQLRIWSMDNFGEDLIMSARGGQIYYWDTSDRVSDGSLVAPDDTPAGAPKTDILPDAVYNSGTPATIPSFPGRAQALDDVSGATASTNLPTTVNQLVVSDRDRHVVAVGCNHIGEAAINPLLVRWGSQGDPFSWNPTVGNTSGGQMVSSGSEIIGSISTQDEVLIWSDTSLHRMSFVGPPYTYSFQLISEGVTVASPMAMVSAMNSVFFMGTNAFHVYSGTVRPLPSTLSDYVFDDINEAQFFKVFAGKSVEFGEVYWFYPSSDSDEVDRYVVYNYIENVWAPGAFDMTTDTGGPYPRTAWIDATTHEKPRAAYVIDPTATPVLSGRLLNHETGRSRIDGESMTSYIESGFLDIAEGDDFSFVSRIIPDLSYLKVDSYDGPGGVDIAIQAKDYPTDSAVTDSTTSVTESTGQAQIRVRARSLAIRFTGTSCEFGWRLGDTRFFMQPDGRR